MALAADQAGGAWQAGPLYSPLLASDADAQWQEQTPNNPSGHVAAGFRATRFGTPTRWIAPPVKLVRAAGWQTGSFGTPVSPIQAASIEPSTIFGIPYAFAYTPPKIHRTVAASSIEPGQFGTPSLVLGMVAVDAGSIEPATTFGTPIVGVAYQAQPIAPAAAFGQPSAAITVHAQGFCTTAFGTPTAGRALYAQSVGQSTRWGVPTAVLYFEHIAEPIFAGAQFGTPSIGQAFRARAIAPTTRFGKPLIQRGNMC